MPQSYIEYSSGLTATTFSVPFKYLNIDNVNAIGTDGTNWTPLTIASRSASANTITLASAPSAFQAIRVYRQSAVTQLVDFQAGARLTESELDTAYNQGLFVAQEVSEDANKNQYTNFNEAALLANTSLSAFHSSTHTGDNSTVTFNLSFTPQTTIPQGYLVIVDGVLQSPVDAYTISISPAQITFTSAPPTSAKIVVTTAAAATGTLVEDTDLRAGINISPTPPAIPKVGELWFDSSIMTMFAYYDDGDGSPQWVSISSSVASNTQSVVATGTTAVRSLSDRFADVVNVKDFGAVGDGITDDTAALQAALNYAGTVDFNIISNKMNNVKSRLFIPSGKYNYSSLNIPDGITIEGASKASTTLIDIGTTTGVASINVGDSVNEIARAGLSNITIKGSQLTNRDGIKYNKAVRFSGLDTVDIYHFDINVDFGDSFALAFNNCYIFGALKYNVKIDNGTASTFENCRIELAGDKGIFIDGQGTFEPINVTFKQCKIQSNFNEGIHGTDVVYLALNECFFEANNQSGQGDCILLQLGTANRTESILQVDGNFFSPGSGQGGIAINTNMGINLIQATFIRGSGFTHGIRCGTSVNTLEFSGEINCLNTIQNRPSNYRLNIYDLENSTKGVREDSRVDNLTTTSSNVTTQATTRTILLNTSGGGRLITLSSSDVATGRVINVQRITGDTNNIVLQTEGSETINGSSTATFNTAFESLRIVCDGTNWFVG